MNSSLGFADCQNPMLFESVSLSLVARLAPQNRLAASADGKFRKGTGDALRVALSGKNGKEGDLENQADDHLTQ